MTPSLQTVQLLAFPARHLGFERRAAAVS